MGRKASGLRLTLLGPTCPSHHEHLPLIAGHPKEIRKDYT